VSPSDTSKLATNLRAVATNRTLRESLIERGTARAAHFTWATAAERFADALHHAER
jgi:glycosyltransferase involved in cell wall biosynthesis